VLTVDNWIAIAGIVATLLAGGGWYYSRKRNSIRNNQKQVIKGGFGIQSGRDVKINDK